MAAPLRAYDVMLSVNPTLSSTDYTALASSASTLRKSLVLTRELAAVARRPAPADLILIHRLRSLIPAPGDSAHFDVYDFDDALYAGETSAPVRGLSRIKLEASRCDRYLRRARLTIAGNAVLASHASGLSRRVEIIPSCVDPDLQPLRQHADGPSLSLGWTGSRTTAHYLRPLIQVIERLRAAGSDIRLVVMGAGAPAPATWIEAREWSVAAERQLLAEIDVGVMPLPDDPWTRGKCGYKLLRYFSAGLPTIATPVGVNARLLAGAEGLPATTESEWASAIHTLSAGKELRAEIGARARAFVEREFSYAVWAPRLAQLLSELA